VSPFIKLSSNFDFARIDEFAGNYVARKFGCRSGMAGFVAKKLCPELILLPLNFDKYNAKASEVREVISEYDPRFESASIDEAYLNITQYCAEHELKPEDAVSQMRQKIHEKTHITGKW
jgi:DNA polymerase kappa